MLIVHQIQKSPHAHRFQHREISFYHESYKKNYAFHYARYILVQSIEENIYFFEVSLFSVIYMLSRRIRIFYTAK